jgi:hypothetical protein
VTASGPDDDLVSPECGPLFGRDKVFARAADEFVLALGNLGDGGAVVMVIGFSFHGGQDSGEGWTNTVQPGPPMTHFLGIGIAKMKRREKGLQSAILLANSRIFTIPSGNQAECRNYLKQDAQALQDG